MQLVLAALEMQARALREGQVADAMTFAQRDPYGGGAVQYQRPKGGFVMFSIGPDLVNGHAACDIREGKRGTIEMGSERIAVASGDLLLEVPARSWCWPQSSQGGGGDVSLASRVDAPLRRMAPKSRGLRGWSYVCTRDGRCAQQPRRHVPRA